MQMNEWDRTDMGFPIALAESVACQYAAARAESAEARQSRVDAASADELVRTWLEVFDETAANS